jgi:hypothetical protein
VNQAHKSAVLIVAIRDIPSALKLDTDREIVATLSLQKSGFTRVPGPGTTGGELRDGAVAADQKMR